MTDFPITPPPELVQQWRAAAGNVPACLSTDPGGRRDYIDFIATQAARWGADQELEACCELVPGLTNYLRAARRPKPPSLKEQALAELEILSDYAHGLGCSESAIRRVLEALPE